MPLPKLGVSNEGVGLAAYARRRGGRPPTAGQASACPSHLEPPRAEPRPSERPDRTDHRRVEPLLTEPRQGLDAADVLRCARRLRQRNLGERGCVPVLGAFAICPALKFEPRPSTCACCDLHRRISGIIGGRAEQPDDEQMLSQLSTTSEAEQQPILQGHSSVDHRHVRSAEGVVITIRHCYLRVAHDLRLQTIS